MSLKEWNLLYDKKGDPNSGSVSDPDKIRIKSNNLMYKDNFRAITRHEKRVLAKFILVWC